MTLERQIEANHRGRGAGSMTRLRLVDFFHGCVCWEQTRVTV